MRGAVGSPLTARPATRASMAVGELQGEESDVQILALFQLRVILSKFTSLHKCFLSRQKKTGEKTALLTSSSPLCL